ncbi:MAG TPA: MHYT domain-containing protein, partial [Candidatus Sulfotelmatobacter sp.]|nr:MHYT domain-containing protein [Candidatus Sulfotelmatobacter sp.]
MHYVGTLALRLPVPARYHWPTVLLSLAVGVLCSGFALKLISQRRMGRSYAVRGSVIMGSGIAGLHYIAMAAMRFPGTLHFNVWIVVLSILLAIGFSFAALWFGFYFRNEPKQMLWPKIASALLIGAAISGMHYTGMAAATFLPLRSAPDLLDTVSVSSLSTLGIGIVTLIVLGLAVFTCEVDRRLDAQNLRLALAEARMELAHASRVGMMGELAASIAHEVNQPINAIMLATGAALESLAMQPPKIAQAQQSITTALKETTRAGQIIGRIRAMLKKTSTQSEPLNINELVTEVLSLLTTELTKGGITVKTDLAAGGVYVEGDRIQLQQVLLNLIMNAIEAMSGSKGPRELCIKTKNNSDEVLVQVEDSAPGLSPADEERIFQPFYTTKTSGLGMGLAISRSIMESHGGHLSARHQAPRGTVFELTMPRRELAEDRRQSNSG